MNKAGRKKHILLKKNSLLMLKNLENSEFFEK